MLSCQRFLRSFSWKKRCIEYKDATRVLYDGALPTVHHVNMLLADPVINSLQIEGVERAVTLQIIEGDLYKHYTHVIMNVTHLLNISEVSSSITKQVE